MYYGKADNDLARRLRKHFYGYGSVIINDLLADQNCLKVRWWNTWELPRKVEYGLIARFEWKFGSRPIANLRR